MRGYSKVLELISGYLALKFGQNRAGEVATAHYSLILKRHFKRKKSEFLFEFVAAIGTRCISSQPRIDAIDVEVVFAW